MNDTTYTGFTEENLASVTALLESRFNPDRVPALLRALAHPSRIPGGPIGHVAWEEGRALCVIGEIPRPVLDGAGAPIRSVGVGYLCKAKHAFPREKVSAFLRDAFSGGDGNRLYIGTTAIYSTMLQFSKIGGHEGPASWKSLRFAILRPFGFLAFVLARKLLKRKSVSGPGLSLDADETRVYAVRDGLVVKRLNGFDGRFDAFWRKYAAGNRGLVASRTAAELEWSFGDSLDDGSGALVALVRGDEVEGYAVVIHMLDSPRRWEIKDMIALGNDLGRIDLLLRGVKNFLRLDTAALTLQARGFQDYVQPTLARALPFRGREGHNPCWYFTVGDELEKKLAAAFNSPESWLFGPYEGDAFLPT